MGTARAPRGIIPAPRGKRGVLLRALSGPGFIPAHAGKTSQSSAHRACPRVHPRSRGENGSLFLHRHMVLGSSPLTRGKRDFARDELGCVGLIPTHAEKTPGTRRRARQRRAQPHSRGENSNLRRNDFSAAGSSPLTRGKLIPVQGRFLVERLIPAHTGKTKSAQSQQSASWAHPRSRRENRANKAHPAFQKGSSPLTRGKLCFSF